MELAEVGVVLARTPGVVEALVGGLPAGWVERSDGAGTWSAYDIVGHLLLGDAANWLPRARMILSEGTGQPFEPFDREAMLGWEREPAADLVARFRAERQASLRELAALRLTGSDLDRRGRHPEFGEVALGQLLASWVAHDLTHLGQIAEVLAGRYRDDVGPWRAYLPALDRVAQAELSGRQQGFQG